MVINHFYTVQSSTLNHHFVVTVQSKRRKNNSRNNNNSKIPYFILTSVDRMRYICLFMFRLSSLRDLCWTKNEEVQKDSFNPTMIGCYRNINNVESSKNTHAHEWMYDEKVGMASTFPVLVVWFIRTRAKRGRKQQKGIQTYKRSRAVAFVHNAHDNTGNGCVSHFDRKYARFGWIEWITKFVMRNHWELEKYNSWYRFGIRIVCNLLVKSANESVGCDPKRT